MATGEELALRVGEGQGRLIAVQAYTVALNSTGAPAWPMQAQHNALHTAPTTVDQYYNLYC